MANGSSRFFAVLVALIVGVVLGWLVHPTPATSPPTQKLANPKPWHIQVGPDPCILSDNDEAGQQILAPTPVSKKNGDTITWNSHGAKDKLYIVLHVSSCQFKPFENAKPLGKQDAQGRDLYLIGNGAKASVDSGQIDPNACYGKIKYDQFLEIPGEGLFFGCDGMIIINP